MNWFKKKEKVIVVKELTEMEKKELAEHKIYDTLMCSLYFEQDRHNLKKEKLYLNREMIMIYYKHNRIKISNDSVKIEVDNDLKDGEYYFSDKDYFTEQSKQDVAFVAIARRLGINGSDLKCLIDYIKG